MKKVKSNYYLRISLMLVCLIMISGCGKKEPEKIAIEEILQSEDLIVDPNIGTQSEGEETVEVKIYFSNKTAENLESELVSLDQLSPEKLIAQLAKKNIVSLDTKVNSFQVYDKDNKVVVDLNLSKEFRDYISLMGTSGEYIIIASLTNTFLEAYKGDVLVLNVAGTTLETGHNRYDQPIERFPITNQEMALHYKIESFEEDEGIRKLRYPQLIDMEDEEFMNRWNEIIRSEAMGNFTLNGMSSFEVDYEIKTQDIDMISILLKGSCYYENAAYPFAFAKTINIDLDTKESLRLASFADIPTIVSNLETGEGFTVLSEGITETDVKNYFNSETVIDYSILLYDYDYDSRNTNLIPTGYSYLQNNKPVLVISVPHVMGDYLEIQMDHY